VREIYRQIRLEFGVLGEPLTLHSLDEGLLAGVWASLRESILAGTAPREWKEAVAVTVSRLNRCPYCHDAHAVMLHASAAPDASAVAAGRDAEIRDPELRRMVLWGRATSTAGDPLLASPPFPPAYAPEMLGAALWIHYINRVVLVFLGKPLIPLPQGAAALRTAAARMGGLYFRRILDRPLDPGASLRLIDAGPPGEPPRWAAAAPAVAAAWSAFAGAVERAGAAALPSEVRARAEAHLAAWRGEDPGLGRVWLAEATAALDPRLRPAARLALLAALAPYRIDRQDVSEFRALSPNPETLLGAVAWSAFAAVRRIASWAAPAAGQ